MVSNTYYLCVVQLCDLRIGKYDFVTHRERQKLDLRNGVLLEFLALC